jgi:Relaxase/Mobilisation nuclease domain
MISKALKAHSFYHTCRYICQKKGAQVLIAEGVRGHDFKLMAQDFINQQQMRPDKENACGHFILSFHPDDKPTDEMMMEIARKYLTRLGIVNTQFAVSKHTDKDHLHMHIVANMVDYEGKSISDSWIGLRGKKIAQQLTQEYKLIPALKKDLSRTHLEALSNTEATRYEIFRAISENLPYCRTMEDLEKRLLRLGIEVQYKYKGQTQEKQGISFKKGKLCFKGSQVDRKYSLGGLLKVLQSQKQQIQERPRKMAETERLAISSRQKNIALRVASSYQHAGSNTPFVVGKGLKNLVMELLKPVDDGGSAPPELSAEWRKKKRKKKPRL